MIPDYGKEIRTTLLKTVACLALGALAVFSYVTYLDQPNPMCEIVKPEHMNEYGLKECDKL